MFPITPVDSRKAEAPEQLGTKRKFWYSDQELRMLFKAEERGTGEDWAEKIACELAQLLGLPHVYYELAEEVQNKTRGVVCENCAPQPWTLVLGNQLLLVRDSSYPAAADGRKYKVRKHTIDAVAEVMGGLQAPPAPWTGALPQGIRTALDVFSGYLLFDAWIANQDRHHENWGALCRDDAMYLAPTFDHGASLARNLTDKERHERLTTPDANRLIAAFVRKARSAFYARIGDAKPMFTLEAWKVCAARVPQAASIWRERLRQINEQAVEQLLREIPPHRMTEVCRHFTMELLKRESKAACEWRRRMNNALFVAWRSGDSSNGCWGPVGRLEHVANGYRFVYTRGAQTLAGFRPFSGMPDLEAVYESEELFPLFANRLLARSRPEYVDFLHWGGFDPNNPPDPLAVLGVTEGRRATDSLEVFPCPLPDADGCYINKFFLHGIRWRPPEVIERIGKLQPGEVLSLMPDPNNHYDRDAVAVRTSIENGDNFQIGYVPRYLASEVRRLCAQCDPDAVKLIVERVNLDAPLQHRLLCRMKACWPSNFRPCAGPEFQPIAKELSLTET